MPVALFIPTTRDELIASEAFRAARRVKGGKGEDVFEIDGCRVTCRYWTRGGDFVSQQRLGCRAAIESRRLRCHDKKPTVDRVLAAKAVIGFVGPDEAVVEALARSIGSAFSGVLVTGETAELTGTGRAGSKRKEP